NERLRPENSEVNRLWCDNSLAKELLNWKPEYGGVEGFKRGIAETVDWFAVKENRIGYKHGIYNV
ncbi:MAG: NAD-dependent dehydratase, partial [Alphaproteobacteria bacterium]|nr:NAD-dependent dehydratase [Alphaproteobacteria bacterium]